MRTLIIGGTGLISTGIIKHLLAREAQVTMFNRGQRENRLPPGLTHIMADRNDLSALREAGKQNFDVVIDMICYTVEQARADVEAFGGRCRHFLFCSTVCTYGVKVPPLVAVEESFPREPASEYGRNKLEAEKAFLAAHEAGKFAATIIRPSSTYGPGGNLIDNLEFRPVAWDRIERGEPVLCAGDGLGLWVSTHRDDVGKLFAYAAMNDKTFGESYNATGERNFTWRDLYRESAMVLGKPAKLLFMPAAWIVKHDPKRFNLLGEVTQFHGAYNSAKARRDVPEFRCEIEYLEGARQTLEDLRRRSAWRDSRDDAVYQMMVEKALAMGVEPVVL